MINKKKDISFVKVGIGYTILYKLNGVNDFTFNMPGDPKVRRKFKV